MVTAGMGMHPGLAGGMGMNPGMAAGMGMHHGPMLDSYPC